MTHKSFFYSLNFDPIQKIFFICNKKWSKKKQILLKLNQKQTNSFKNLLQINRKTFIFLKKQTKTWNESQNGNASSYNGVFDWHRLHSLKTKKIRTLKKKIH